MSIQESSNHHHFYLGSSSPPKVRKSVSFADQHGLELSEIRYALEPSCLPPKLDYDRLGELYGTDNVLKANDMAMTPESTSSFYAVARKDQWRIKFEQPGKH